MTLTYAYPNPTHPHTHTHTRTGHDNGEISIVHIETGEVKQAFHTRTHTRIRTGTHTHTHTNTTTNTGDKLLNRECHPIVNLTWTHMYINDHNLGGYSYNRMHMHVKNAMLVNADLDITEVRVGIYRGGEYV